ncbi:alpha/beta fold hydrolase [Streptomyces sp. NPDC052016]|uniref:alpha/beta fold hydrolase n=1 Tax=Streptomyces sp. NPDC052016 TaxID=3365680 RepID=UPI0037D5ECDE
MNDITELKQFIVVHAKAQGLSAAEYQPILDRIRSDDDGAPDSWATVWRDAGDELAERGKLLDANRRYVMARFPYVDGPGRARAQQSYLDTFERWSKEQRDIEPLTVTVGDDRVRCWTTGLSTTERRPLVLIMGGIISVKEQWAPTLRLANRLGLAAVVTELPGVGENTMRYDADGWRMITAVLDSVADRADATRTTALALSFSGHLALRCALTDHRIRAVITAGAPVGAFFTDRTWQGRLPRVTVDTLAHLARTSPDGLAGLMPSLALSAEQLAALDIPVYYLASRRDEVIPPEDLALLRAHVRDLHVLENDDVHGSPHHVLESRLWIVQSLMRLTGRQGLRSALLGALLRLLRRRSLRTQR